MTNPPNKTVFLSHSTSKKMKKIKWGIVGAGWISQKFCEAITVVENGDVQAVFTKTRSKAEALAKQYTIPIIYDTLESLLNDKAIDIVYIATPHPSHAEIAKACLNADKPVLCEKPFTMNLQEAIEIVDLARAKRIFLMEAMWTRFLPQIRKAKEILDSGKIGKVVLLQADLAHIAPKDPNNRFYNKALGGGALLDLGVYPVSFALYMLGMPDKINVLSNLADTGVDETMSIAFHYKDGRIAQLFISFVTTSVKEANIYGEDGTIRIHSSWFTPSQLSLVSKDGESEKFEFDFIGNGYNYEIEECHRCLREGKTESKLIPLSLSLDIMQMLDWIEEDARMTN